MQLLLFKRKVPDRCQSQRKNHLAYTVRHIYLTTITVLLMSQTQRFILTVSPPGDL